MIIRRPPKRVALAILAAVALPALLGMFVLRPALADEKAANTALVSAQDAAKLHVKKPVITDPASTAAGLKTLYDAERRAELLLPTGPEKAERGLPALVAAQGLTLGTLSRGDDVPAPGGAAYTPFKIAATGSMASVLKFVSAVESGPEVVGLADLSLAGSPTGTTLTVTLQVWHSAMPPLPDPKVKPRATPKPTAGPSLPGTAAPKPTPTR